jgi:hypothetical protein
MLTPNFPSLFAAIDNAPTAHARQCAVNTLFRHIADSQIVPELPDSARFRAPDVCSARWTRLDWLRHAYGFPTL